MYKWCNSFVKQSIVTEFIIIQFYKILKAVNLLTAFFCDLNQSLIPKKCCFKRLLFMKQHFIF